MNFDNFDISHNCFHDQNISLIFYVKEGSHVRLRHPSCVYITAQYTAVQKPLSPIFERVSLNKTLEFPVWGLNIL